MLEQGLLAEGKELESNILWQEYAPLRSGLREFAHCQCERPQASVGRPAVDIATPPDCVVQSVKATARHLKGEEMLRHASLKTILD